MGFQSSTATPEIYYNVTKFVPMDWKPHSWAHYSGPWIEPLGARVYVNSQRTCPFDDDVKSLGSILEWSFLHTNGWK